MLIPIQRYYISTGQTYEVLVNTDYIIKIEPSFDDTKPETRIVMQGRVENEGPDIMYTMSTIKAIRTLITRERKK